MDGHSAARQSELLDVQLLDVFAQIESLLRGGREVQREALRVRGLPIPATPAQRRAAGGAILDHLHGMTRDGETLGGLLTELLGTATTLEALLAEDESAGRQKPLS